MCRASYSIPKPVGSAVCRAKRAATRWSTERRRPLVGSPELQFTIDVGIPEPSDPEPSDEAMEQDSMDDSMEQDSMMGDDYMIENDSEMSDEAEEAADESEPDIGTPSAVPSDTTFAENPRTGFTLTSEDDTSTFSLDVDQTSYFLALNWSRNNYLIEPDSARAEEWVNSFDYGYAAPESDDEFAISTSIQPHPLNDDLHIAPDRIPGAGAARRRPAECRAGA